MNNFRAERRGNRFFVRHSGKTYNLTPPEAVRASLPPYAEDLCEILKKISKKKGIEGDFEVEFFEGWRPNTDFSVSFVRNECGGRMYELKPVLLDISATVWVCGEAFLSLDNTNASVNP